MRNIILKIQQTNQLPLIKETDSEAGN